MEVDLTIVNMKPSLRVLDDDTYIAINRPGYDHRRENWNWLIVFGRDVTWRGREYVQGDMTGEYCTSRMRALDGMFKAIIEYEALIADDADADVDAEEEATG